MWLSGEGACQSREQLYKACQVRVCLAQSKKHQEASGKGVEGMNSKILGYVARERREGADHVEKWELLKGFQ